jgi:lipopolysaccharide transport system ATP-binding protein
MNEVASAGRTVLMVSHNMTAVEGLCTAAMWIEGGRVAALGRPREVITQYLHSSPHAARERLWNYASAAPAGEHVRLRRVAVSAAGDDPGDVLHVRTPVAVDVDYDALAAGLTLNVAISVHNEGGTIEFASGSEVATCLIPGDLLNDGRHSVTVMIVRNENELIVREEQAVAFDVEDEPSLRGAWYGSWPGVVRPRLEWKSERLR